MPKNASINREKSIDNCFETIRLYRSRMPPRAGNTAGAIPFTEAGKKSVDEILGHQPDKWM
ncbi:hypothetical protein J2Z40_003488 [Cytobacillus eiseniae]|uniref:Uncharacterized protein n=1 Tax=Cytobacillus eiseniae TaxID=762947 RepID=A0ABS4RKH3_9BACI|nr:hypothetical protein [Cytobacillus eiseniae]MBP2242906.1 hypothetical protein [Cytobacillus eiseniae]